MRSCEYDAKGTAAMVGKILMRTLSLSKEEIGRTFCHAVYDGVYSQQSERRAGSRGGSLSLMEKFTEWCGLEKGDMTGHWDAGHLLQLIYGDALKDDNNVNKFNNAMYEIMSNYNSGKNSVIFREKADSLHQATLTNKSKQSTRWVAAELRSTHAYFTNLPTFYFLLGDEIQLYAEECDITSQKETER